MRPSLARMAGLSKGVPDDWEVFNRNSEALVLEIVEKLGERATFDYLIVDEAQGLGHELLEEIRLLLNFETYTEKQLQIILAGQPELRQVLNDPSLRQLKQRISLRCEIKPARHIRG